MSYYCSFLFIKVIPLHTNSGFLISDPFHRKGVCIYFFIRRKRWTSNQLTTGFDIQVVITYQSVQDFCFWVVIATKLFWTPVWKHIDCSNEKRYLIVGTSNPCSKWVWYQGKKLKHRGISLINEDDFYSNGSVC